MLPYETATKDTLMHYLPRAEVHSTCNFQLFLGNRGHPAVQLLHMPLSMHTSLAILQVVPSPLLPHTTHVTSSSPHPRRPSSQYLPTFQQSSPSKQ